jgi:precorrin-2 dehydrogenase/sirohydrochlorin ferrochelatase
MQPYLQVSLSVRGRRVVVIGSGEQAEERVVRLLEAQAQPIIVVAPKVTDALARWAQAGKVEHRAHELDPNADLTAAFLVLLCDSHERSIAERLFHLCEAHGVLFYAQDMPEWSHIAMPALVRRGHLRMAISTGEASPALAGAIRRDLEKLFDESFVHYTHWLDDLRQQLRDDPARSDKLRAAVEGFGISGQLSFPGIFNQPTTRH